MIKCCPVQLYHAEAAPFMFGMTALARAVPGWGELAMEVRALRDVGANAFMTIGASRILRDFAK
jgi:hypothetical protein